MTPVNRPTFNYSLSQFKKDNLWIWPYYDHFWSFFAHCIYIFHQLKCWWSLWGAKCVKSSIRSKATRQNTNCLISSFFQFWKKNFWKFLTHKWPFFDYFWSYYANYRKVFHKSEVQTVILRCLVCLNLIWIKSYNIMLVKIFFFHAWKCIIPGLVCRSDFWHLRRKPILMFSK